MEELWRRRTIIGLRMIQLVASALTILGTLWVVAELLKLTLSQFMLVYGFTGIIVPEIPIRLLTRGLPKEKKFRQKTA